MKYSKQRVYRESEQQFCEARTGSSQPRACFEGRAASDKISPLWPRQGLHLLACSSIAILALLLTENWTIAIVAILSGTAIAIEVTRFASHSFNQWILSKFGVVFKRVEHDRRITGATCYILSATFCLALFPKEIAVISLLYLSFGDPVAARAGSYISKARIWGKSPIGTLAFFAACIVVSAVMSTVTELAFDWRLVAGAAVAAIVELLPVPHVDDNITVPIASSIVLTVLVY